MRPTVVRLCFNLCIYLIDVCYLWPHILLFDRFLFGFPAWEWQHHLRGMRHPEERRNSWMTLMHTHIDRFGSPFKYNTHWLYMNDDYWSLCSFIKVFFLAVGESYCLVRSLKSLVTRYPSTMAQRSSTEHKLCSAKQPGWHINNQITCHVIEDINPLATSYTCTTYSSITALT